MALVRAWIQASRPLAQANIAIPLAYGQALAWAELGAFSWELAFAAHAFGLFDQLTIVWANDAADAESDRANRTYSAFSGGSRVVPEGKLTPRALLRAASLAAVGMLGMTTWLALARARPLAIPFALVALALLWAYSFRPIRLSYRDGGALLQGLGVGVVLPALGFYAQSGRLDPSLLLTLAPSFMLAYAGNIVTALPDTPSDGETGKCTLPVRRGERQARHYALFIVAGALLGTPLAAPRASALVALVPFALLAVSVALSRGANALAQKECARFVLSAGATIASAWIAWTAGLALAR